MTPHPYCRRFPAISLRLKSSPDYQLHNHSQDLDILSDQVAVMAQQELNSYFCGDYLCGGSPVSTTSYGYGHISSSYPKFSFPAADQALDAASRKKMIDWKFRVVDHFGIPREIVATSTSVLDRFVFRHPCDRMTFKLAAITSLYMATKVHDQGQLDLIRLANLSKGEFIVRDIEHMESKMLRILKWRVNPVTVNSFIRAFLSCIPSTVDPLVARSIHDRAMFFAELCLYDSTYIARRRSSIAVAAILNALEGIDDSSVPSEHEFLDSLRDLCYGSMELLGEKSLEDLREDLWYIYSMSSQYREDDMKMMAIAGEGDMEVEKQAEREVGTGAAIIYLSHSPVSVLNRKSS